MESIFADKNTHYIAEWPWEDLNSQQTDFQSTDSKFAAIGNIVAYGTHNYSPADTESPSKTTF